MNTNYLGKIEKPWGWYQIIYQDHNYWTKLLQIAPYQALSLQYHSNRSEYWVPLDSGLTGLINGSRVLLRVGTRYDVMPNVLHRIINHGHKPVQLIEVATGTPDEDDIIRIHDLYKRE